MFAAKGGRGWPLGEKKNIISNPGWVPDQIREIGPEWAPEMKQNIGNPDQTEDNKTQGDGAKRRPLGGRRRRPLLSSVW